MQDYKGGVKETMERPGIGYKFSCLDVVSACNTINQHQQITLDMILAHSVPLKIWLPMWLCSAEACHDLLTQAF